MNSIATKNLVNNYHIPNQYPSVPPAAGKHLGGATGGGQQDVVGGCAAWVEQNRYIYDAIMSGSSGMDQTQIQEFMAMWEYAYGTAFGSSWDPSMGGGAYPGQYPQGPGPQQPLPPGATMGANGNLVYDQMDANIEHTPSQMPIDIYGNNVTINSGSMMTTFTWEITTDTRFNPPEQVLKGTASDGTVYFIHDYEDAIVTQKTPMEDMVKGPAANKVTWAEFDGPITVDPADATPDLKDPQIMIDNLLGAAGKNEGQLLTALKTAGYPYLTMDDFKEAITNGDFPGEMNQTNMRKLLKFLNGFDPNLNQMMNTFMSAEDCEEMNELCAVYRDYLVSILGFLYPDSNIMGAGDTANHNVFEIDSLKVELGYNEDGDLDVWVDDAEDN